MPYQRIQHQRCIKKAYMVRDQKYGVARKLPPQTRGARNVRTMPRDFAVLPEVKMI